MPWWWVGPTSRPGLISVQNWPVISALAFRWTTATSTIRSVDGYSPVVSTSTTANPIGPAAFCMENPTPASPNHHSSVIQIIDKGSYRPREVFAGFPEHDAARPLRCPFVSSLGHCAKLDRFARFMQQSAYMSPYACRLVLAVLFTHVSRRRPSGTFWHVAGTEHATGTGTTVAVSQRLCSFRLPTASKSHESRCVADYRHTSHRRRRRRYRLRLRHASQCGIVLVREPGRSVARPACVLLGESLCRGFHLRGSSRAGGCAHSGEYPTAGIVLTR